MRRARNGFVKNLNYLCLVGVVALGLLTIIATGCGGGNGGGGYGGKDDPAETARSAFVADLRAADRDAILASFLTVEDTKNEEAIYSLSDEILEIMADWIEDATLRTSTDDTRTYDAIYIDDNGITHTMELVMAKNEAGEWKIASW